MIFKAEPWTGVLAPLPVPAGVQVGLQSTNRGNRFAQSPAKCCHPCRDEAQPARIDSKLSQFNVPGRNEEARLIAGPVRLEICKRFNRP
jgi:hypothetical protein